MAHQYSLLTTHLLYVCYFCRGELLLWDLSKEGKEQCQMFGLGHSRIVFNISCDVGGTRIMTVSMDRQVQYTIKTIGTISNYCMRLSLIQMVTQMEDKTWIITNFHLYYF